MSLRIVLVGQAAFAKETLERFVKAHEVLAAYGRPTPPSGKPDPFVLRAKELGILVRQPKSMKTPGVEREIRELGADLGVLAFVTVIVPERVIEAPRLGTICFHPSLLPRYRGGSAINWQILRGETRGGLSVFWTDAGVDTGPLLLRKEVEIGPDDTTGSLYFEKIFPLGIDAMEEAVDQIDAGTAARDPQGESEATHDPLFRDEHATIDFGAPAAEVYAAVRASDPQPGAWARHGAERLRLYDARLTNGAGGEPGTVLAVDGDGIAIALAGGTLRARRVRLGYGKKAAPDDLLASGALSVGDRLTGGSR